MFGSKNTNPKSNEASKLPPEKVDTLFAVIRRISQRVTELEAREGNDRRDINRLTKQVYRTEPAPHRANDRQAIPEFDYAAAIKQLGGDV